MTWQSATCFSALVCLLCADVAPAASATVSGRIAIANAADASGRKKKDLSETVVWLESSHGGALHRSTQHARIVQKDKRFTPHILVIAKGTTVDFPNLDPIFHNAFSNFDGQIFDLTLYPPGTSRAVQFDRAGIVRIFCNIHPAMSAVVVVVPTDAFATTTRDGAFTISNVDPGEYQVHFFDERATPDTLSSLTRSVSVNESGAVLALTTVSEAGYLPAAHKNKYGRDYPAASDDTPGGYSWPGK